jgi:hypothetical protein
MFDPFTFALAAVLLMSLSIYLRHKRRRARAREFDGGFDHDNRVHITTIKSPYIKRAK